MKKKLLLLVLLVITVKVLFSQNATNYLGAKQGNDFNNKWGSTISGGTCLSGSTNITVGYNNNYGGADWRFELPSDFVNKRQLKKLSIKVAGDLCGNFTTPRAKLTFREDNYEWLQSYFDEKLARDHTSNSYEITNNLEKFVFLENGKFFIVPIIYSDYEYVVQNIQITIEYSLPPTKAIYLYPEDEAVNIPIEDFLVWERSSNAEFYSIYLGTTNPPEYKGTVIDLALKFSLEPIKKYYWRVDAISSDNVVTEGDVWRFTTQKKQVFIKVDLNPSEVNDLGAAWKVNDDDWKLSGEKVYVDSETNHKITFKPIDGWAEPRDENINIPSDNSGAQLQRTYTVVPGSGALKVTISPTEVVDSGAMWSINNGVTWNESGAVIDGLQVGNYTIKFKSTSGWTTPQETSATINENTTTNIVGQYIQIVQEKGQLKVTLSPSEAITAGALWNVDGGDWRASDYIENNLDIGSHTVNFKNIPNWTEPSSRSITISGNQITNLSEVYLLINGDSDGDQINDDIDQCPSTPTGETVDANGCSLSQKTYLPDNNFEQALIDLGYDDVLDNYVATNKINTITELNIESKSIQNLTGIEDFIKLEKLDCYNNNLTELNVSNNVMLKELTVWKNKITELDVSKNLSLQYLNCDENELTFLDVSKNISLTTFLTMNNKLTNLNVRNGNNTNLTTFWAKNNPLLKCIDVDNAAWSITNWSSFVDSQTGFNDSDTGCPVTSIPQLEKDALIALYNSTNGENWSNNDNWNTSLPVNQWYGVTVSENHVSQITLFNNNLTGTIPTEIGNLSELAYLNLSANNLNGEIPDLSGLNLSNLIISRNSFNFGDFENEYEYYKSNISNFYYSPMNKLDDEISYDLVVGENYSMTMSSVAGTGVTYQWYKNEEPIAGEISSTLTLNNLQVSDAGDYICKAFSPIITDLIIERETIHVYGDVSEVDKNALIALYDATNGDNWTNNSNWKTSAPIYDWYGVSIQGTEITEINLTSNNLEGEIPEELINLTAIKYFGVGRNQLTGDIPDIFQAMPNIDHLLIYDNNLTGVVNLSNLNNLEGVFVFNNELSEINIRNVVNLKFLNCRDNQLTKLDIRDNVNLEFLSIGNNQLSRGLDISKNISLSYFNALSNPALVCIQINQNQQNAIPTDWYKDNSATYNLDCSSFLDDDSDGVMNNNDLCPNTPLNTVVNENGCFALPSNNFKIEVVGETCPDKNNGSINIEAVESFNYAATINGTVYNFTNNTLTVTNLAPNSYNVCITVDGQTFEQCYTVIIPEGTIVSGKTSVAKNKLSVTIDKGTGPFSVFVNGVNILETSSSTFDVDAKHGDLIEVKTNVPCEGILSKVVETLYEFTAYPNPTTGIFEIAIPSELTDGSQLLNEVVVEIYNAHSTLVYSKKHPIINGKVVVNIESQPTGLYVAKVKLQNVIMVKIIKQ